MSIEVIIKPIEIGTSGTIETLAVSAIILDDVVQDATLALSVVVFDGGLFSHERIVVEAIAIDIVGIYFVYVFTAFNPECKSMSMNSWFIMYYIWLF